MKTKNVSKKPRLDLAEVNAPPEGGKPKPSKLLPLKESSNEKLKLLRLSYPLLPIQDLNDFPKLSTVISTFSTTGTTGTTSSTGNEASSIPIEDVDNLQTELETLLSVVTVCKNIIETENSILENLLGGTSVISLLGEHYDQNHQEKINAVKSIIDAGHGTRTSVSAAAKLVLGLDPAVPSTSKKGGGNARNSSGAGAGPSSSSRQPKKKLKDTNGKEKPIPKAAARAGVNRSHSVSMDDSCLRLEAPNQFWEFADTYCREITIEDIEQLEQDIEDLQEFPDSLSTIPPLGKYYDESNKARKTADVDSSKDVVGPLTQRLVSALVEDKVAHYTAIQNNSSGSPPPEPVTPSFINRKGLVKALGLDNEGAGIGGNGSQLPLEAKLKQVLLEQGFLPSESEEDMDDEVLCEIKRTRRAHQRLRDHNLKKMQNLLGVSKAEYNRIQKKKDLEKADKEIIDAYRTINSLRIKRKPVTQKEKSMAVRALGNRQGAINALNSASESSELVLNGNASGSEL